MSHPETNNDAKPGKLDTLTARLDEAVLALAESRDFAKATKLRRVFDTAKRVMMQDGGCAVVEARAQQLDEAGVFLGSDWSQPEILLPSLSTFSLRSPETDTCLLYTSDAADE